MSRGYGHDPADGVGLIRTSAPMRLSPMRGPAGSAAACGKVSEGTSREDLTTELHTAASKASREDD